MELPKIDFRYLKQAFREPINIWGMAGFAMTAAYFWDVTPLAAALATEALYLAVVPATPFYRRLVERREKERARKLRDAQRETIIKGFDPREREAVEYLRWMKNQIYSNYKKFTTSKQVRSEERRVGKECRYWRDWSSDVCSSDLNQRVRSARARSRRVSALDEEPDLFELQKVHHQQTG